MPWCARRILHWTPNCPNTAWQKFAAISIALPRCADSPGWPIWCCTWRRRRSSTQDTRTRHLIAALRRGKYLPRRLVYISTSGIYGDCGGAIIGESQRANPQSARARRRVDAEAQLRRWGKSAGAPCVSILRAPGIYATGRLPVERIRRGDPVLNDADDVYTNHIHADDLARCALAALRHGSPNRAYHASDDSVLRMAEWFDAVADAHALPHPRRVSRAEAASLLSPLVLSFMRESRRLDNTRLSAN
jgi:nucleoside-diphosphate-sugar epimerase